LHSGDCIQQNTTKIIQQNLLLSSVVALSRTYGRVLAHIFRHAVLPSARHRAVLPSARRRTVLPSARSRAILLSFIHFILF
jgi:hypothetical protein